jgi:hypothetical protein
MIERALRFVSSGPLGGAVLLGARRQHRKLLLAFTLLVPVVACGTGREVPPAPDDAGAVDSGFDVATVDAGADSSVADSGVDAAIPDSAIDPALYADDGGVPCGPRDCNPATAFCLTFVVEVGPPGSGMGFSCDALPAACLSSPTCSCVEGNYDAGFVHVQSCDGGAEAGVTLTGTAP